MKSGFGNVVAVVHLDDRPVHGPFLDRVSPYTRDWTELDSETIVIKHQNQGALEQFYEQKASEALSQSSRLARLDRVNSSRQY